MPCSCVVKGLGAIGGSFESRVPAGRGTQLSGWSHSTELLNCKECYCEYLALVQNKAWHLKFNMAVFGQTVGAQVSEVIW